MMAIETKGLKPHSEEWHAIRKYNPARDPCVVFGASEAAAVCGVGRYSSPLQVYLEKRGEWEQERDAESQQRMDNGHLLEPVILDMYERQTGQKTVRGFGFLQHDEYPWVGATPDAMTECRTRCVDAKSTNWRMFDFSGEDDSKFGNPGTDQVPVEYLFQAQQQMLVTGAVHCDFPVLSDGLCRIYTVERNEQIISHIVEAERDLMERIKAEFPPEPDWDHSTTIDLLKGMYDYKEDQAAYIPEYLFREWMHRQTLKKKIKNAEEMVKQIDAKVLHAMGDAVTAVHGDRRIKRVRVRGSLVTPEDVEELAAKVGQVKRKASSYLMEAKGKVKK
jgi:putative phage-type endonuclease